MRIVPVNRRCGGSLVDLLNGNNSCSSLLLTVMSFGCGAANSVVHKTLNFETHSPLNQSLR